MPKRSFKLEPSLYPADLVAQAAQTFQEAGFAVSAAPGAVEVDAPGAQAERVFDELANHLLALRVETPR